jgi:altronate dehydratase large subunit
MASTFLGYPREDGTVGVRNWVAVVSVIDVSNPVTRAIVRQVDGTIAVTTLFVRGQYGSDLKLAFDILGGLGRNPNVAAVLLIGLEEQFTEEVAKRIRPSGKPVEAVLLQPRGTIHGIQEGTRKALRLVRQASNGRRISCPASALRVGVECGGSDTTSGLTCNPVIGRLSDRLVDDGGTVIISETTEFLGAEHLFAARAVTPEIGKAFTDMVLRAEQVAMSQGMDIRGTNPSPDNIRGGLTTIEEKSLGAMSKAGTRPLSGVLSCGGAPTGTGLHFLDAPAPAVENLTSFAAAGCQLILFGTGVGNPIGNMVATTVKVSGNVHTLEDMADNMDFDASDVIEKRVSVTAVGDRLYGYALEVASGTRTASEVLDVRETAISRFGPTI